MDNPDGETAKPARQGSTVRLTVVASELHSGRGTQSCGSGDNQQISRAGKHRVPGGATSVSAAISGRRLAPEKADRLAADSSEQASFVRHTRSGYLAKVNTEEPPVRTGDPYTGKASVGATDGSSYPQTASSAL